MNIRVIIVSVLILTATALAQPRSVIMDSPFQVRYMSNLSAGDSTVNITNSGARGADLPSGITASVTGSICVNVYTFAPDEQMISCCSCPVTPNGLVSLSGQRDLISNPLTPAIPSSVVVKLLASVPVGGTCNAASPGQLSPGLHAWASTVHAGSSGFTIVVEPYQVTETPFLPATLSAGELSRLTNLCTFMQANGSGFGICRSCRLGGLGGARL